MHRWHAASFQRLNQTKELSTKMSKFLVFSLTAATALLAASCTPIEQQAAVPVALAPAVERSLPSLPMWQTTSRAPGSSQASVTTQDLPVIGAGRTGVADKARQLTGQIAAELAERCPVKNPGDQTAFDTCRQAMFAGSKIRTSLAAVTLWGRQNTDPEKPLKETNLTQFGPDVLTGMYMPLFMFSGKYEVSYNTREKLYRAELGVQFRNRLQPGQFPYPFWHEEAKWSTYEGATAILLWIDPKSLTIRTAQFTTRGTLEPASPNTHVARAPFDGKWMWTDQSGAQQPKVTLFDGLFRRDNPHLGKIDAAYRDLALTLREGQCMACHVPNNPYKTSRLVLLQTPAHAAAEIKRVIASVRSDNMPIDGTTSMKEPLDAKRKQELLLRAVAFEKIIDAAKQWEASARQSGPSAAPKAAPVRQSANIQ
jgi:hypothetical protein